MINSNYILNNDYIKNKSFFINFGPQHPAAHGVLRLILELSGERVLSVDPHIGLLHRGTEKLIENRTYLQSIPYFDRLDYVSMLTQEHAFVLAIEYLNNMKVAPYVQIIRTLFDEITRLLNHIMSITTHALDIGAITPFLWGFEEREELMKLYEIVSGARMHAAYYRPGGLVYLLPDNYYDNIYKIIDRFLNLIDNLENILNNNPIWLNRLKYVGFISKKDLLSYGFSGPLLRAGGISWDIRVTEPYEFYENISFKIPVATESDSYSRYIIRLLEMKQSIFIIKDCLNLLLNLNAENSFLNDYNSKFITNKALFKSSMEELINHFLLYSKGLSVRNGSYYSVIEAPKGETGVFLVSSGYAKPYRCKIKSPGFLHLQGLDALSRDSMLADVVTNIGTLDIVFGEIDR